MSLFTCGSIRLINEYLAIYLLIHTLRIQCIIRYNLTVYQLLITALQYIMTVYRVCGIYAYSLNLAECICGLLRAGLMHTVSVYRSQVPWIYFLKIPYDDLLWR